MFSKSILTCIFFACLRTLPIYGEPLSYPNETYEIENITEVKESAEKQLKKIHTRMQDHVLDKATLDLHAIPIEPMLKAVDSLSSDSLQYYDEVKLLLSQLVHGYLELIMYETALCKRQIYPQTLDEIPEALKKVRATLPNSHIETRFHIDCSMQIIKSLSANESAYLMEALQSAYSQSATGLLGMIPSLYKARIASWYISFWPLRWLALIVHDLETFNLNLKKPIEKMMSYKKDKNYGIGCSLLLIGLMEREDVDPYLKQKVLYNYLFPLMNHRTWEVRYFVINTMAQWMEDSIYAENIAAKLLEHGEQEKNNHVKHLLSSFFSSEQKEHVPITR